jgi:4-amino-4-deoxy-L-arabinose transferase-like glycosyltransferase
MIQRITSDSRLSIVVILLLCAAAYLPKLGQVGLRGTEGHRVIPAVAMLEGSSLLHPEMFEASYARKPPGSLWGIAASVGVGGALEHPHRIEWAARLGSVVVMTLCAVGAYFFASRWFGARHALPAAAAQALTPILMMTARTAEIEPYNIAATAFAAWLLADLIIYQHGRTRRKTVVLGALTGLALAAVIACKGPASFPILIGMLVATRFVPHSQRDVINRGSIIALALMVAVAVGLQLALTTGSDAQISNSGASVWSHLDHFLWQRDAIVGTLLLIPSALLIALPLTIPLVFLVRMPTDEATIRGTRGHAIVTLIGVGFLLGLGLQMLLGMHNPRYTLPLIAPLPPLVSWAYFHASAGRFTPPRLQQLRAWPAVCAIGLAVYAVVVAALGLTVYEDQVTWSWPTPGTALAAGIVIAAAGVGLSAVTLYAARRHRTDLTTAVCIAALLVAGWAWIGFGEPRSERRSARDWGPVLASDLAADAVVWSNDMIEANPELLLYARLHRPDITVSWRKDAIHAGALPNTGQYLLLRPHEYRRRYAERGTATRLRKVAGYVVWKHTAVLFRVAEDELPVESDPFADLPQDRGSSRKRRAAPPDES